MTPVEALVKSGLVTSHSEARRIVESGGFRVGEYKTLVSDINARVDEQIIWCGHKRGFVLHDTDIDANIDTKLINAMKESIESMTGFEISATVHYQTSRYETKSVKLPNFIVIARDENHAKEQANLIINPANHTNLTIVYRDIIKWRIS